MPSTDISEDDLQKVSTFEDLLKAVGAVGRWSTTLFIVSSACAFVSSMHTLSYQFLGATPDYWCHVDPLVKANWSAGDIINIAVPMKDNSTDRDFCKMYNFDYTRVSNLGIEDALLLKDEIQSSEIIDCPARDFNTTQYKSTVTTDWDLVCERRVLYATTQAAAQAGKFIGYLIMGVIMDRFGRRPVVLACSTMTIICGFLTAASPNVEFYIFLKIVITIMTSGFYLGLFVMSMETCSTEQRSLVGSFFVLPWAFGYMTVPGIAYLIRDWHWLQVALTTPALFLIAYFWILPESPRWLILRGRYNDAFVILKKAAKMNGKTWPSDKNILTAIERVGEMNIKKSSEDKESIDILTRTKKVFLRYFALLRMSEFRCRTLVVYFCWFASSMIYYGVALNATNLSADPYIYMFLGGLLEVPAYILCWPFAKYIGSTKSLAFLYGLCGVTILSVMLILLFAPGAPIAVIMFFSLTGKMAITIAFHLIWMFTAELFPTKYRSMAVGQASVKARIGSMCSPYIIDLWGEVLVWGPSLLFGIISIIAAGLSLLLPDSKGKALPEISDFDMETPKGGKTNEGFEPEKSEKEQS